MVKQTTDILSGNIVENETRLTLRQLCDSCAVRAEYIIELVDEGFIEPSGVEKSHWCFSGVSIKRVQKAKRLQRDLGINLAGVALVIDLIDEIEYLRARLESR
ncbi:MAG: MerR family transcriptional regulator [Gammaproteobacteria bacterium]|jgi:chaperone modulatory protein CbpM|nr:MerR family transcriptional regulator [Gammaproteobacteria bacterium]